MPHLTLEASDNVPVDGKLRALFGRLHAILSAVGGIKLETCKSRAYIVSAFLVADGSPGEGGRERAFVHLDIRFMDGRSPDVKQSIARQARDALLDFFQGAAEALDLQVTVEVRDIDRQFYAKYPEGTLTPQ